MTQDAVPTGPLAGYRVLELCSTLAGPFATMLLADQGADVIKIESAGGDQGRQVGSSREGVAGMSTMFLNVNRNKRSVLLDLKSPADVETARAIARQCDVVVQNFRPGVVERLGMGYDDLRALREDIIYVSISGLGETGIGRRRRVYDVVLQGIAGFASVQADTGSGEPHQVQQAITDKVTSLIVAQAATAALLHRARTGLGQHVKVNMLDAALAFIWPESMPWDTLVGEGVRKGGLLSSIRYIFPTADDPIVLGFVSNDEFEAVCQVLERTDLLADARFATIAQRFSNAKSLNQEVAAALKQRPAADWLARLATVEAVYAPVNRPDQIHDDPHVIACGSLEEREHPLLGRYRQPVHPASFSATPAQFRRHAPLLGEHTEEVLADLSIAGAGTQP
ncbi:CoA transferase [Bosea sp. (in: a-proteobacteria)]|jgi:crotonobetainyl-CoA:carnitine CoA-transferase CaiB-like acyl-CoA transferase|uniref:CaiB/BaiF CoA transferase family protein n=1 Tax=Bosea sp. (in: a-proteobacteria) TaxID=1871050 RepID=UPI002DDD2CEF|nr:CoA transferase [Bosea sp. (in: a-proteobacteria)]HEV2512117.1 CoA transferase [Bosea sp. (in: a-proteobacteria)]